MVIKILLILLLACESKIEPKEPLLLPNTCYFINNSSMQEINRACQKEGKEGFFSCVCAMQDLDYDVCDDYDYLWMEEFQNWEGPLQTGLIEYN